MLEKLDDNFKFCSHNCIINNNYIQHFNEKELKLIMQNKHICRVDKKSAVNFKNNIV